MSNQTPFQEMGRTYVAVANGTSGTIIVTADSPPQQYSFYNANATTVYVNIGSAAGNTTAAVPVPGTPAYGMPIPGATRMTLSGWQGQGSNVTIAVISVGPNITNQVFITPGEGFLG